MSLLNDVKKMDDLIRDMEKLGSKILNGQEVLAWRDHQRILAQLKKVRQDIIAEADSNYSSQETINEK